MHDSIQQSHCESAVFLRRKIMTDEIKKNEGKTPEQPGQQQGKNPQDVSKQPNSSQDRNKELDEKQDQPEQGGHRRAS
jgi:hypothetical protein